MNFSKAQTEENMTQNSCEENGYIFRPRVSGCYKIYEDQKKTWIQAQNDCTKDGADLLIINNKKEEKVIFSTLT